MPPRVELIALAAGLGIPAGLACAAATVSVEPSGEVHMEREKLKEVVAKAAAQPAAPSTLSLLYERGHALSGTIRFEMSPDRRFRLASNVTAGRRPGEWQGTLTAAQSQAILVAASGGLLDTASSTRPIGDDEEPVFVTLRAGAMGERIALWDRDAAGTPAFHAFEMALLKVLKELSGDAIIATVD